jgi:hypothetical protein
MSRCGCIRFGYFSIRFWRNSPSKVSSSASLGGRYSNRNLGLIARARIWAMKQCELGVITDIIGGDDRSPRAAACDHELWKGLEDYGPALMIMGRGKKPPVGYAILSR